MMMRSALLASGLAVLLATEAGAQPRRMALESVEGLRLHNVAASAVTHEGQKGLRLTLSQEAERSLQALTPEQRQLSDLEELAVIDGVEFQDGTIEAEIAGAAATGAAAGARGFVGIAFRLQKDMKAYDAFYLRPTNGRAEEQERRNHSAQYISHPDWPWFRLRKETPERYESYVDLVPGAWTKVRIVVEGTKARLFVHGQEQPTLVVNDVKTGAGLKGAVALWLGPGTIAHFRNLRIDPAPVR
jgi:hypothetical protein